MMLALLSSEMFSPINIELKKENAVSVLGRITNLKFGKFSTVPAIFNFAILYNFQPKNNALRSIPKNQKSNKLGNHDETPLEIVSEVSPIITAGN